jgi:glycine/D-amino acid oxidase-like deaminating enzyme
MTDVIVIGGGLDGLVAAAMLAKAKLSVILLDQRPALGGACSMRELAPGFRIPELSHSLGPVSRDVVKALRLDHAAGLEFITPDPSLTSIGDNNQSLSFHRDAVLTAASINTHSTADAGQWNEFVRTSQRIAGVIAQIDRLAPPPIDDAGFRHLWRLLSAGRAARKLSRRDLTRLARWLQCRLRTSCRSGSKRICSKRRSRRTRSPAIQPARAPRVPARSGCSGLPRTRLSSAAVSRPKADLERWPMPLCGLRRRREQTSGATRRSRTCSRRTVAPQES